MYSNRPVLTGITSRKQSKKPDKSENLGGNSPALFSKLALLFVVFTNSCPEISDSIYDILYI